MLFEWLVTYYLKVAVAELDCQALLAGVCHGATIRVDGDSGVSPAGAVEPFLLEDVELRLAHPIFRCAGGDNGYHGVMNLTLMQLVGCSREFGAAK